MLQKIYAVALRNDGSSSVNVKNDVEAVAEDKKAEEPKKAGKAKTDAPKREDGVSVSIDFDGIDNRVMALPMDAADYNIVGSVDGGLLYTAKNKPDALQHSRRN